MAIDAVGSSANYAAIQKKNGSNRVTEDEMATLINPFTSPLIPFTNRELYDKLTWNEKLTMATTGMMPIGGLIVADSVKQRQKDESIKDVRLGPAGYGPGHPEYEEKSSIPKVLLAIGAGGLALFGGLKLGKFVGKALKN